MLPPDENYKRIDPLKFTESSLPIFIVAEDRWSLFGWAIRNHSKDNYNHAEIMVKLGKVASQDPGGYREITIEKCLVKQAFLKFWQFDPVDRKEIDIIRQQVEKDLVKPWWKRRYDFFGIIGQGLGLRWIQSPWGKYCSESVAANLRLIPRLQSIVPRESNPSELNQVFKAMPDMKLLGYWWSD